MDTNGTYTIPATEGVTYFVNGKQTAPGTYSGQGRLVGEDHGVR
jgi:hypothetical protein